MDVSKKQWIIIGVFFWGLPTGILVALIAAVVGFRIPVELGAFDLHKFLFVSFLTIPFFSWLGYLYGRFMSALSEQQIHQDQLRSELLSKKL